MSDSSILKRVASGDDSAVNECLDRYGGLVWSLARRFCPDHTSAEDAVQEIFLAIWKSAERYDSSVSAETTFIAMIARRRLIDIRRKKEIRSAGEVEWDAFSSDDREAGDMVEINDEARRAAEMLRQLPADQRRVIQLSVYDGLSHSKIAEKTGLSLGTVKTHIRRGVLKLREKLYATTTEVMRGAQ